MIRIKRWLLVFLVVLALAAGAFAAFMYVGMEPSELLQGRGNFVRLSSDRYEELTKYSEVYEKADELRKYIEANYYVEVNDEDIVNGMYYGMFDSLGDPYSSYMTKEDYENELASLTGDYSGVGVTVAADEERDMVIVISPTSGTPAEAAGLRPGDYIYKVDGVAYTASQLDICAAAIRGPEGSDVVLTVIRDKEEFEVTITREHIILKSVEYEMRDDGLAYIQISSFMNNTDEEFAQALADIEAAGAKGLIIDLRNNGGGLVESSVRIADELMDKATVVYTEDQNKNRYYYKTYDGKTDIPSVVLINEGTASSSEILTAGLQDNGVCKVVGTKSFGKGIIQNVFETEDGSAVKLTILQYFTPSGKAIHKIGITPDYIVELTDDCYDEDGYLIKDLQLERAAELLNGR